jgi:hypothetical protein
MQQATASMQVRDPDVQVTATGDGAREFPALVGDARGVLADLGKLSRKLEERSAALDRMAASLDEVGVAARSFNDETLPRFNALVEQLNAIPERSTGCSRPWMKTPRASSSAHRAENRGPASRDSRTGRARRCGVAPGKSRFSRWPSRAPAAASRRRPSPRSPSSISAPCPRGIPRKPCTILW